MACCFYSFDGFLHADISIQIEEWIFLEEFCAFFLYMSFYFLNFMENGYKQSQKQF